MEAIRDAATPVDLDDPAEAEIALRVGRSWIDLRRGARTVALREYLYGHKQPLEQSQMDALDLLARRERTMSGLAERMKIDRSTATRAVDRLVEAGLAERTSSVDDGRVVMVSITHQGRRRHTVVAARRAQLMAQVLAAFEPEERRRFAEFMERFIGAVDSELASARRRRRRARL